MGHARGSIARRRVVSVMSRTRRRNIVRRGRTRVVRGVVSFGRARTRSVVAREGGIITFSRRVLLGGVVSAVLRRKGSHCPMCRRGVSGVGKVIRCGSTLGFVARGP